MYTCHIARWMESRAQPSIGSAAKVEHFPCAACFTKLLLPWNVHQRCTNHSPVDGKKSKDDGSRAELSLPPYIRNGSQREREIIVSSVCCVCAKLIYTGNTHNDFFWVIRIYANFISDSKMNWFLIVWISLFGESMRNIQRVQDLKMESNEKGCLKKMIGIHF